MFFGALRNLCLNQGHRFSLFFQKFCSVMFHTEVDIPFELTSDQLGGVGGGSLSARGFQHICWDGPPPSTAEFYPPSPPCINSSHRYLPTAGEQGLTRLQSSCSQTRRPRTLNLQLVWLQGPQLFRPHLCVALQVGISRAVPKCCLLLPPSSLSPSALGCTPNPDPSVLHAQQCHSL